MQKLDERFKIANGGDLGHILDAIKTVNLGGYAKTISQCIETTSEISNLFQFFADQSEIKIPHHTLKGAKPSFKLNRLTDICIGALSKLSSDAQFTVFIDGLDVRPDEVS